jgi:hypothetical protein
LSVSIFLTSQLPERRPTTDARPGRKIAHRQPVGKCFGAPRGRRGELSDRRRCASGRRKQEPRSSRIEAPGQRGLRQLPKTFPANRLTREGRSRLVAGRSSGFRFVPGGLPPRLPIPIPHRDSGLLRRASPVTAARPRPILTAFPFIPSGLSRSGTCNWIESRKPPGGCQAITRPISEKVSSARPSGPRPGVP